MQYISFLPTYIYALHFLLAYIYIYRQEGNVLHVNIYVCVCVYICIYKQEGNLLHVNIYVCVHIYIYICVCVCVCVYVCVYIYIYHECLGVLFCTCIHIWECRLFNPSAPEPDA